MEQKTYSQQAEDLIVCEYLASKGVAPGQVKYVDIGTNHPTMLNNTYFFYTQGASGVLVEPQYFFYDSYASERPRDTVIKGGIYWTDVKEGYVRKVGHHGGGSYVALGTKPGRIYLPCPLFRINDVLHDNFETCPDFISIDTERGDFEIMKDLDFQTYPIPVICGEFRKHNMSLVDEFMFAQGYTTVKRTKLSPTSPDDWYSNSIYMR